MTAAPSHMDAEAFLHELSRLSIQCDLAIFDPPYSPGQIVECYKSVGIDTADAGQNGALYKRTRDALLRCLTPNAIVLSFGWNSAGMGKSRGFEIVEILLVAHGGAHCDTICLAEKRLPQPIPEPTLFDTTPPPRPSGGG